MRTTLLKSNFGNIIVELHNNGVVVWCFISFLCLRTLIWRRNGHWQQKFASAWIIRKCFRLTSLSADSRKWNYEVLFFVHRHGTHDQIMCLIFLFLASFRFLTKCTSSHLETLISFCMEMFKFSEFDLQQTTTKSTTIVYISLDFFLSQTLPFTAIKQTPPWRGSSSLPYRMFF